MGCSHARAPGSHRIGATISTRRKQVAPVVDSVYDEVASDIAVGKLKADYPLPKAEDFADVYEISRGSALAVIKKLEDAGLVHRNHSVFVSRQSNTELVTRIDALLKWAHQNKISFDTVMHAVRGRTRPEESRLLETPTAGQPSQPAGESASESDTARERFTHAEAKKQQLETNPHAQTENRAAMIEEPSFTQGTDRPLAERASSQTDNAPSNVGEPVVSSEPVPVVVDPPLRIGDGSARVDGDALPVVDVAAGVDASERSPRAVNGVSVTGETPKYEGGVRQASAESQWVDNSEPEEWEADLLRQEPWRN